MLGGPGDRIAENAVLNMARRDIAPGWRDRGGLRSLSTALGT